MRNICKGPPKHHLYTATNHLNLCSVVAKDFKLSMKQKIFFTGTKLNEESIFVQNIGNFGREVF